MPAHYLKHPFPLIFLIHFSQRIFVEMTLYRVGNVRTNLLTQALKVTEVQKFPGFVCSGLSRSNALCASSCEVWVSVSPDYSVQQICAIRMMVGSLRSHTTIRKRHV